MIIPPPQLGRALRKRTEPPDFSNVCYSSNARCEHSAGPGRVLSYVRAPLSRACRRHCCGWEISVTLSGSRAACMLRSPYPRTLSPQIALLLGRPVSISEAATLKTLSPQWEGLLAGSSGESFFSHAAVFGWLVGRWTRFAPRRNCVKSALGIKNLPGQTFCGLRHICIDFIRKASTRKVNASSILSALRARCGRYGGVCFLVTWSNSSI